MQCGFHRLILILGLIGMVLTVRKRKLIGISIILVIFYFFIVHIPYFEGSRYGYPIMPIFIILAAYPIVKLFYLLNKSFKIKI